MQANHHKPFQRDHSKVSEKKEFSHSAVSTPTKLHITPEISITDFLSLLSID
jgi:hypothetical protein